jgi:hypothetical protein
MISELDSFREPQCLIYTSHFSKYPHLYLNHLTSIEMPPLFREDTTHIYIIPVLARDPKCIIADVVVSQICAVFPYLDRIWKT